MTSDSTHLPPPMNHVFVDFENVHQVDLSVIGSKSVTFTLLLGARQTKLDAALVMNLIERLCKAKHLTIGDKDIVTYHF